MILDSAGVRELLPFIISVVVVSRRCGQPIAGVSIYSSDTNGKFYSDIRGHYHFLSWQEPPFDITVAHDLYEPIVLTVTDPAKPCLVKLHEPCI
jgi:hypothetical protein